MKGNEKMIYNMVMALKPELMEANLKVNIKEEEKMEKACIN